jgi:hypothetical protein
MTTSGRTIGDVRTCRHRAPCVIPRRRCFVQIQAQLEADQRILGGTRTRPTTRRESRERMRDTAVRVRSDPTGQIRWVNADSYVARDMARCRSVTRCGEAHARSESPWRPRFPMPRRHYVGGREAARHGADRRERSVLKVRSANLRSSASPVHGLALPRRRSGGTSRRGVGAFDLVLKLANVGGPVIRQLAVQDGRGGSHNRTVAARGRVGKGLTGQGRQIVGAAVRAT